MTTRKRGAYRHMALITAGLATLALIGPPVAREARRTVGRSVTWARLSLHATQQASAVSEIDRDHEAVERAAGRLRELDQARNLLTDVWTDTRSRLHDAADADKPALRRQLRLVEAKLDEMAVNREALTRQADEARHGLRSRVDNWRIAEAALQAERARYRAAVDLDPLRTR